MEGSNFMGLGYTPHFGLGIKKNGYKIEDINIFHKNREISILTMKKKMARLTLPQEATERTKQGETKNKTKNEKHTPV
jgi:hypothetical protein